MSRKNKRTTIAGQFAPRLIEMLRSPAYRALSLSEHRIMARLEIELADHGGTGNGKLPATFDDFEKYGVHRHSIAPALRALQALGFIEITERGRAGNGEWRRPHVFRLTYRHTEAIGPTDDWKRIDTPEVAEVIAATARKASQKRNASVGNRTSTSVGNRTTRAGFHSAETTTTRPSAETTTTIDISGRVRACA